MRFLSRCPNCGKLHVLGPDKCDCGHDFKQFGEKLPDWALCPRCGAKVKFDDFACKGCKTDTNKLFRYPCPKCRRSVGIKDRFCTCGKELIPEPERRPRESIKWVCSRCGTELASSSSSCPICE